MATNACLSLLSDNKNTEMSQELSELATKNHVCQLFGSCTEKVLSMNVPADSKVVVGTRTGSHVGEKPLSECKPLPSS